ncbi:MAG: SIS domain-containing protein, partial [Pseudomonadales bacterium]|nr:SIS domain-containing protein [Pseudomonadales bacterium]
YQRAVEAMQACPGKILTTGIGKAGYMASKFAATLCSTATPAHFVHPAEAAHGDLGIVGPRDCIVAFSTSGKSREVLEMLELARHLGLETIIGVTSHPDSPLRELSDIVLDMGVIQEPCPIGLTPSASIAVMLAISDALALTLMEVKGVSKHDYGLRHHGGYLGRAARTDNE